MVVLAYRFGLAKALAIRASPFGAPSRLFCSRDRASGYWAGLMKVLRSGQAFACLHPHPSSRFRQSPVVGPDGDPRPPESVLARHVRRRRIQTPLRKRPREAPLVSRTERNIVYLGVKSIGVLSSHDRLSLIQCTPSDTCDSFSHTLACTISHEDRDSVIVTEC